MTILSHDEILILHAAIVSAQLVPSRSALLVGVDGQLVAGLPTAPTPSDQILQDLDALNKTQSLADGSVPLVRWLKNAVARAAGKNDAKVFQDALGRCLSGAEALGQTARSAGSSSPQQPSGGSTHIHITGSTLGALVVGDGSKAEGSVHIAAGGAGQVSDAGAVRHKPVSKAGTLVANASPRGVADGDADLTLANVKGKVDFAILTIREDEFDAVLERFPPFETLQGRRMYNLHRLDLPAGGSYLVAMVRCIEQGNTEALDATRDILEELQPRWLLVVGIAGAVPSDEFGLGDVVVSTRFHDFSVEAVLQDKESEYAMGGGPVHKDAATVIANLRAMKVKLQGWNTASSIIAPRPPIELDEKLFYGGEDWQERTRKALTKHTARTEPLVTAGAVGSSDRLVKDTKILATFLLKAARQVLAVEMESAGVYRGASGRGVPAVAIRGISDVVGFKRDPGWTAYSCHSAAAFTRAFLRTRPVVPREVPSSHSASSVMSVTDEEEGDKAATLLIERWLRKLPRDRQRAVISFAEVDESCDLPRGTSVRLLPGIVADHGGNWKMKDMGELEFVLRYDDGVT